VPVPGAYHERMRSGRYNVLVVLGPTASGKTRLGVELARAFNGEIVSADSRQAYRGLDLGSGKDLAEYTAGGAPVPYHLIDIVELDVEFSVFDFQHRCFDAIEAIAARNRLPVLVGGTGLYLEAVLSRYRMVEAPPNAALRAELAGASHAALIARLLHVKPDQHNTTDLVERHRILRAIEIAEYARDHEPEPAPDLRPLILGTRWPREELRQRIYRRLVERLDQGMIDEVAALHASGVPWPRLKLLGLEYRHIARFLEGEIADKGALVDGLAIAIGQFAKKQETWFRRMERRGTTIHWIDRADVDAARRIVAAEGS